MTLDKFASVSPQAPSNLNYVIMLLRTKFRVNQTINRPDMAKKPFSLWQPSAILNLQNFGILLSSRPWKHNLHLRTKFR